MKISKYLLLAGITRNNVIRVIKNKIKSNTISIELRTKRFQIC